MLEQLEIYLIPCNDPPFAMMAATLASPYAHIKLSIKDKSRRSIPIYIEDKIQFPPLAEQFPFALGTSPSLTPFVFQIFPTLSKSFQTICIIYQMQIAYKLTRPCLL